MEIVPAFGWTRNVRLSNGEAELIATLDVGPRILSYKKGGGPNVLKTFADQLGGSGEADWMIRGGHRLWVAPEDPKSTYAPDNSPVLLSEPAEGVARLTSPAEVGAGVQKEIDIHLAASGCAVRLVHRLTNVGWSPSNLSAWALTVLAPGGTEIIPLPPKRPHPGHPSNAESAADYAPDGTLILWPFFDFSDDRWRFGRRFITLRQDAGRGPTKLGLGARRGPVGYLNGGTLFVKRFAGADGLREYPDLGACFETFTNGDMLEMESLGPIARVAVGESIEWEERWDLFDGLPAIDPADEDAIAEVIGPYLGDDA